MREFVLDASFALKWCFEDEATAETEALLTLLQNEERLALVPDKLLLPTILRFTTPAI